MNKMHTRVKLVATPRHPGTKKKTTRQSFTEKYDLGLSKFKNVAKKATSTKKKRSDYVSEGPGPMVVYARWHRNWPLLLLLLCGLLLPCSLTTMNVLATDGIVMTGSSTEKASNRPFISTQKKEELDALESTMETTKPSLDIILSRVQYAQDLNHNLLVCEKDDHFSLTMECPVETTTAAETPTLGKDECLYWDTALRIWSDHGCELVSHTPETTICRCNHLTDFGVAMENSTMIWEKIFRTPDLFELFVVHWYALLALGILLTLFFAIAGYGHRYDQQLQRKSSMRGSLVALHIFSGMLKRHRLRKDADQYAQLQMKNGQMKIRRPALDNGTTSGTSGTSGTTSKLDDGDNITGSTSGTGIVQQRQTSIEIVDGVPHLIIPETAATTVVIIKKTPQAKGNKIDTSATGSRSGDKSSRRKEKIDTSLSTLIEDATENVLIRSNAIESHSETKTTRYTQPRLSINTGSTPNNNKQRKRPRLSKNETEAYRQVALDKFMGRRTHYTRPSLSATQHLWGFKLGEVKALERNKPIGRNSTSSTASGRHSLTSNSSTLSMIDDSQNSLPPQLPTQLPPQQLELEQPDEEDDVMYHVPSFCQMLVSRMIQEHEILELYFINDRWLTRVHRSVIFLGRVSVKVSIVGTFFVVRNTVSGWDSVAAIFMGFVANKIAGGFMKFLFVLLAKKRRQHSMEKYKEKHRTKRNSKTGAKLPVHEQRRIQREMLKLEIEDERDRDAHWTCNAITDTCVGCSCNDLCFDIFSIVVWLIAISSICFCLFFGVMFAFALENSLLAAAFIQSVIGSICFWLFFSRPLIIVVKTIISKSKAERLVKKMNKQQQQQQQELPRTIAIEMTDMFTRFSSDIENTKEKQEIVEVVVL